MIERRPRDALDIQNLKAYVPQLRAIVDLANKIRANIGGYPAGSSERIFLDNLNSIFNPNNRNFREPHSSDYAELLRNYSSLPQATHALLSAYILPDGSVNLPGLIHSAVNNQATQNDIINAVNEFRNIHTVYERRQADIKSVAELNEEAKLYGLRNQQLPNNATQAQIANFTQIVINPNRQQFGQQVGIPTFSMLERMKQVYARHPELDIMIKPPYNIPLVDAINAVNDDPRSNFEHRRLFLTLAKNPELEAKKTQYRESELGLRREERTKIPLLRNILIARNEREMRRAKRDVDRFDVELNQNIENAETALLNAQANGANANTLRETLDDANERKAHTEILKNRFAGTGIVRKRGVIFRSRFEHALAGMQQRKHLQERAVQLGLNPDTASVGDMRARDIYAKARHIPILGRPLGRLGEATYRVVNSAIGTSQKINDIRDGDHAASINLGFFRIGNNIPRNIRTAGKVAFLGPLALFEGVRNAWNIAFGKKK